MSSARLVSVLAAPALLAVLILAAPAVAIAGDWTGDVNLSLGRKKMKETDWWPVENQDEFAAEMSFGKKSWPVRIATDVFGSYKEDSDEGIQGTTAELGIGIRKIWGNKRVHPYLGGGAAFVGGALELDFDGIIVRDDDTSLGAWVGGGVFWRIGRRFNLGLAARYSKATVTLFGTDFEAGGSHGALILGWGWPARR